MDQLPALEKLIQNFMAIQKLTLTQSPQSDISDIIFSFFLSFSLSSGKCLEEERNVKKRKEKKRKEEGENYIYIYKYIWQHPKFRKTKTNQRH